MADRNEALDAARALALAGVLLVNATTAYRAPLFAREGDALGTVIGVLVEGKAFGLLAAVFGVGLAIQAERGGAAFLARATRRHLALLALGALHIAFAFTGDVLVLYGAIGLVVAPLVRARTPVLVGAAVVLLALHLAPLPTPPPFASAADLRAEIDDASHVYAFGSFAQVTRFRVEREALPAVLLLGGVAARTAALFALGVLAYRLRALASSRALAPVAGVATLAGIAMTLTAPAGSRAAAFAPVLQTAGYGLLLVAARRHLPSRALAPLGRVTLSAYLMQSLVASLVFDGYGLGLFGRVDRRAAAIGALIAFALQAALAAAWLRRFRTGPAEWLVRRATYLVDRTPSE